MAETMSYALLGSLIFTLTLVPVLASYWFTHGVKRRRTGLRMVQARVCGGTQLVPGQPESDDAARDHNFRRFLLLIPYIGGEFMPHLDEGAIWVRATMPYTISFEEAAKFAPQIRSILMSYPMVTDVGSELARPTTAPTPPDFLIANSTSA